MRLLAIFAHPDDESFGPAGTIARHAYSGHQVGIVTLTCGEAGSLGISSQLSADELARRRTGELHCAARTLGVTYLKIFDLPDKRLSEVANQHGINLIHSQIDFFKPDVLLTFHKQGISGHPDHRIVSRWVVEAVKNLQENIKLLLYGILPEQAAQIPQRKFYPLQPSEVTHQISVKDYLNLKIEAIQCHVTQAELWKVLPQPMENFFKFAQWEYFKQVWPTPDKRKLQYEFK